MSYLEFTGERLHPDLYGKASIEHLHRYSIALDFVKGKRVLDIASGEGYGSNLLAKVADQVVGVDISYEAIKYSKEKYIKKNLRFVEGSVYKIPFDSNYFDVVVSFETLEHISDHNKMVSEIKRVLRPDGILIISTPEKVEYSNRGKYVNPYHEKELEEAEFKDLISSHFKNYCFGYQKFQIGSLIQFDRESSKEVLRQYKGDFTLIDIEEKIDKEYLISVCSDSPFKVLLGPSFFKIGKWEQFFIKDQIDNEIEKIKRSYRYRLGNFLLFPFSRLKKIFK